MNDNGKGSQASTSTVQWSQPCRQFEFGEILSATENFDKSLVIGGGGFGKVYKGSIVNGSSSVVVAIKRLDSMSNQGASEFWAEVEMLSNLRHCHLVSLIGYCNNEKEMILVYEYMPNGTLEDHLHKLNTPLSWLQRLKICIGAARGLDYLHTGTGIEFGVIHRDVKSSNILLDKSWAAKISDFRLSKLVQRDQQRTYVSTLIKGTFGYLDPNYYATGKLTTKSDVYAFGVVLLEVLCRKRAVDKSLDCGLATWALDSIKEGSLKHIIDSDIRDEISAKCLKGFVQVAERCLNNHPKHRPAMAEVVFTLESVLDIQPKTNNLLQTAGKTIFYRMANMFSSTKNSGMAFASKKKKLLMLRDKIPQQNGVLVYKDKLKVSCLGSIHFFSAKELEKATNNYADDRVLDRGRYGIVYKGVLPDTRVVAIKRYGNLDEAQLENFKNEIIILEQINHKNVVQLLGCCLEIEEPLLVFEFISNGSLYDHIHNKTVRLSWDRRLRIAHESAGALAYLHTYATVSIIHRDVKSAIILLDENFTAKVSGFGASKLVRLDHEPLTTLVIGTVGYLDPEYLLTCRITDKSDVYSFGVVLLELLTGKKPIDMERVKDEVILTTYFEKTNKRNQLYEIIDPVVLEEATDEQLRAACELACRCLERSSVNRPSMTQVSREIESLRNRGTGDVHDEDKQTNIPNIIPQTYPYKHHDEESEYSLSEESYHSRYCTD